MATRTFNTMSGAVGFPIAARSPADQTIKTGMVEAVTTVVPNYEPIPAGTVDQVLGAGGLLGDLLTGLLVVPATTSPGAITIKDGSGSAITVFAGGAASLSNLVPFFIPIGAISMNGAWSISVGANVSVLALGNFE